MDKNDNRLTRRKVMRAGAAAAAGITVGAKMAQAAEAAKKLVAPREKILNYNENMEYRRLGKTGVMVSAISLGGHWKHIPFGPNTEAFKKNRYDVLSACMDHGINWVDACTGEEVMAYSEALRGRRDKMYLGYSWYQHEMRIPEWQNLDKLMKGFEDGLRKCKLEYVDLWRITCHEAGSTHTPEHEEIIGEALAKAKKDGKARFVGFSSHDRPWLKKMIETYPQVDAILTPYTAFSKKKPKDSLFDTAKKLGVGLFGIKPFASGSVFKARGAVRPATKDIDDERARMTLRYVLCNDALTAPIPGLITIDQVKNACKAVVERRKFDAAEARRFEQIADETLANLPEEYQWLKNWEWV